MPLESHRERAAEGVPFALVHDLMRRVHDSDDLQETLDAITSGVTDLVDFGIAAVCLARGDGTLQVISVSATDPIRNRLLGSTTPLWDLDHDGEVGESWGLFRYVPRDKFGPWQGYDSARHDDRDRAGAWQPYDSLYAPLRGARGEVIGMLQVDLPPGRRKPVGEVRDLLDFFAIQAGMAVRQHLEQQRLSREIDLARLSQEIAMHAVESEDLDALLTACARTLHDGFHADRAIIRLTGDAEDLPVMAWTAARADVPETPQDVLDTLRCAAQRAWQQQKLAVLSTSPRILDPTETGADMCSLLDTEAGPRTDSLVQAPLGIGGEFFGYIALLRQQGGWEWDEASMQTVSDIAHNLGTAILNARLLQRERSYIENLRSLDDYKRALFATISHEFKGPLTSITGHAELLQDRDEDDPIDFSVSSITRNAARLTSMVEDLMLLQQIEDSIEDLRPEPVDLRVAVTEALDVWRMNADQLDLDVRVLLPDEPVLAFGQRAEIDRVVINLVSNAVKYSRDGGRILLAVGHDEAAVGIDGPVTWFRCTDDGLGMSQDDQARLFDQFFRGSDPAVRRISGTGLGLSIVRRILEQHGGTIDVASKVGEGSTFTVRLPAAPAPS